MSNMIADDSIFGERKIDPSFTQIRYIKKRRQEERGSVAAQTREQESLGWKRLSLDS